MTSQTGTITSGRRMSAPGWITLLAVALVAVAVAVGAYALVDRSTTTAPEPAAPQAPAVTAVTIEGITHVPGLVKGGLQPRPFSPIPEQAAAPDTAPAGFVRIGTSDEFRPIPGDA